MCKILNASVHGVLVCVCVFESDCMNINLSINLLFKVQSHPQNGLRTLLDTNINTLIKQRDTDMTELTEIVRGKQQVRARMYLNSEEGQQVTFHSALRIKITLTWI